MNLNDIATIKLYYDTKEKEEIYVKWEDDGDFWMNKYQNNKMDGDSMEITIKEDKS